jgi:hypothetical protein
MTSATMARAIAVAAVATATSVGTALPASAATGHGFVPRLTPRVSDRTVRPATTKVTCKTGDDVENCAQIIGAGSWVSEMWMSACYHGSGTIALHDEIVSPDGTYWNSPTYDVGDGGCVAMALYSWYAVAGPYSFRAWRKNSNGTYTDTATFTLTVDA